MKQDDLQFALNRLLWAEPTSQWSSRFIVANLDTFLPQFKYTQENRKSVDHDIPSYHFQFYRRITKNSTSNNKKIIETCLMNILHQRFSYLQQKTISDIHLGLKSEMGNHGIEPEIHEIEDLSPSQLTKETLSSKPYRMLSDMIDAFSI